MYIWLFVLVVVLVGGWSLAGMVLPDPAPPWARHDAADPVLEPRATGTDDERPDPLDDTLPLNEAMLGTLLPIWKPAVAQRICRSLSAAASLSPST
jgi:hypothetical protein